MRKVKKIKQPKANLEAKCNASFIDGERKSTSRPLLFSLLLRNPCLDHHPQTHPQVKLSPSVKILVSSNITTYALSDTQSSPKT